MPNPKRRHSRHRTMNRRNKNWKLTTTDTSACSNCGAARPGHTVCPACGFYKGKLVVVKKTKKTKKDKSTETPKEES